MLTLLKSSILRRPRTFIEESDLNTLKANPNPLHTFVPKCITRYIKNRENAISKLLFFIFFIDKVYLPQIAGIDAEDR